MNKKYGLKNMSSQRMFLERDIIIFDPVLLNKNRSIYFLLLFKGSSSEPVKNIRLRNIKGQEKKREIKYRLDKNNKLK